MQIFLLIMVIVVGPRNMSMRALLQAQIDMVVGRGKEKMMKKNSTSRKEKMKKEVEVARGLCWIVPSESSRQKQAKCVYFRCQRAMVMMMMIKDRRSFCRTGWH